MIARRTTLATAPRPTGSRGGEGGVAVRRAQPARRAVLRGLAGLALLAGVAAGVPGGLGQAHANELIEVTDARIGPAEEGDGWVLSADFGLPLPQRLEEAVNRGVPLYFVVDFELFRPRWYWWDERVAQASQTLRLSYHALTRQYRVTLNGYPQSYASLAEALRSLSAVRGWKVAEAGDLKLGTSYEAQVRMRLDMSQLPKPFQVTAITNRDWTLQAEWKRFTFTPETPKSAQ